MIRRLALWLGAIVVGLVGGFFSQPAAQAHDSAGTPAATYTYTYDRDCNAVAAADAVTDRGPPASYSHHTPLGGAEDLWLGGASARSVIITTYAYSDHDSPERLSRVGGVGATNREPGSAHVGDLSSLALAGVAANTTTKVGPTTIHGAERIAGAGATRGGVLGADDILLVRGSGQLMTQADGAAVRVLQNEAGRFNVVVDGERGLITTFSNLSQKSLERLATGYGWE